MVMSIKQLFFTFFVLSLCLPISVEAANWVMVESFSYRGETFNAYIDTESIRNAKAGEKEVLIQLETIPCSQLGSKCSSYALQYGIFFANKTFCIIDHATLYTDGSNDRIRYLCEPKPISSLSSRMRVWEYLFQ